ncbi:restriction endonuclease subunit S [Bifidobacterium adolescentis]|uniref:Restriction endonuclease subunit S n=1 Tax=Bifidobacterium adolescentis TaxID=1680 RepID=A0AAF1A5D9_BIFAD|nr:restriction endonuclease subunit S [Bifidobacterium adolescentis]WNE85971.1 restriction endonuclease subunit S [Bifidobacterium adolescentis]
MAEQHGKTLVPQIRFAGFTDPWEQRKLGDILQERNVRTSDFESNPIFSLTIEDGITPKTDRYERTSLITKTEDLFKIVSPNEFVTNPMNLRFGAFGYNKNSLSVCVSGYYDVFSIDNDKCSGFWNSYFKTPVALKRFDDAATGSLIEKRRVKYSTLCQLIFLMPKGMGEKKQIGAFFDRLDSLITLHQRKYDKLCVLKKSMLDKMFPKGGSLYPEIRFAGFTDPWEQRKLGEVASKRIEKNTNGIKETFTNSAEHGIVSQLDYFDHDITNDANIGNYSVVYPDDFVYNPRISTIAPCGPINRNKLGRNGVMSPLYTVFSVDDMINKLYLEHYFTTNRWHQFMFLEGNSGARSDRFSISDSTFFEMPIQCPVLEEQELIALFFDRLDTLITLHQRKLELLRNIKKSMLDKMFV